MDDRELLRLCRQANAQVWAGECGLRPGGAVAGDESVLLFATGLPEAYWNGGIVLARPADLVATLESARAFFRVHDLPYGCLLPAELLPSSLPDIGRAGYQLAEDGHDLMAVRPDELRRPEAVPGLELRRVRTPEETDEHVAVVAATLGPPGEGDPVPRVRGLVLPQVGAPGYTLLTGYVGGRPVCAATATRTEETVAVFGVGTLESHRGRGYGSAITLAAVATGLTDGARLAWLNPSPMARSTYARLGFVDLPGWSVLVPTR